jgi:MFS-type transporter involved in bile tolerance (Atg22 family)
MTDYVFLSTTSVAIILVGVAVFAMLTALVLGTFGDPKRSHKAVMFVSLTAIWATAVLVVVFIG